MPNVTFHFLFHSTSTISTFTLPSIWLPYSLEIFGQIVMLFDPLTTRSDFLPS
jgi:hypothetical protein